MCLTDRRRARGGKKIPPKHGSSGFVRHAFPRLRSVPPNLQHESKALQFPVVPSGLRFSMFSRRVVVWGCERRRVEHSFMKAECFRARRCLPVLALREAK